MDTLILKDDDIPMPPEDDKAVATLLTTHDVDAARPLVAINLVAMVSGPVRRIGRFADQ